MAQQSMSYLVTQDNRVLDRASYEVSIGISVFFEKYFLRVNLCKRVQKGFYQ
jgi:hypothetical protein